MFHLSNYVFCLFSQLFTRALPQDLGIIKQRGAVSEMASALWDFEKTQIIQDLWIFTQIPRSHATV